MEHTLLVCLATASLLQLTTADEQQQGKGIMTAHALEGAVSLLHCPHFKYDTGQVVTWTKKNEVNKLNQRMSVSQRSGALRIHYAQFMDSGHYICTVKDGNITSSQETILFVESYPKVTVQNASVAQGHKAILRCKAESTPASKIYWKPVDVPVSQQNERLLLDKTKATRPVVFNSTIEGTPSITESELIFSSVQPSQAGLYLCVASNRPGVTRATATLSITFAPVAVVKVPKLVGLSENGTYFHIQFKANPDPHITCQHLNQSMEKNSYWKTTIDTRDGTTNITLQVMPELSNHSVYGTYTCTATNNMGHETAFVYLLQESAPDQPVVKIFSQRPTWLTLELQMPSSLGIPSADRIITRYQDLSMSNDPEEFDEVVFLTNSNDSQKLNLTGLKPGHDYQIMVHLANNVAHSRPTLLTTTLPLHVVPDPVQFVSESQSEYSRTYILKWHPPNAYGSAISGYSLNYTAVHVDDDGKVVDTIGPDHNIMVNQSVETLVISGLQENTYYRVSMTASNKIGSSPPSCFIFKTANYTDIGHHSHRNKNSMYDIRLPQDVRGSYGTGIESSDSWPVLNNSSSCWTASYQVTIFSFLLILSMVVRHHKS